MLGTKSFNDGVLVAERQGLKGRHLPTMFLCTLQGPYKISVLLFCSIRKTPDDFKDFRYFLIRSCSWFTVKFSTPFWYQLFQI